MFNLHHHDHHHHRHIDLVITTRQMELFSNHMTEVFVEKTILFLQKNFAEWAADKDDAALSAYIRSMMAFGKKHNVLKQINLQKLMHYHIRYAFEIPLHKDMGLILDELHVSENNRVRNFYQHLKSVASPVAPTEFSS